MSAYMKDYDYFPSWRESLDKKLVFVAVQKDYLEVRFGGLSSAAGSSTIREVCYYSYDWLRDICRCKECFNIVTHNKQTAISRQTPLPKLARISEEGEYLEVSWVDGHDSRYPKKVLFTQHIHTKAPRGSDPVMDAKRKLWGSKFPENCFRRYEFESLIADDQLLFRWLMDLRETGITVVKKAPRKPGQLIELCNRVAYTRPTCWGTTFQVGVQENGSHIAFRNHSLPLHTDAAYYMFPAGVQLTHCIKSCGGEVIPVADGFRAAEKIRRTDPECFDLLTKIEWEYFDIGNGYLGSHHLQARHPVIRLGVEGRLQQIVYSDHSRGWRQDIATSTTPVAYKALRKYSEHVNADDSMLKYTLKEGDVLVIDNFRVLHGRSKVNSSSSRHLEVAYLDWDEICSKLRSLTREQFL